MSVEWKLFGKVVHHPVLVTLSVISTIVLGIIALVLSPVLVPVHYLLRKLGKNGFYFNKHVWIGKDSFTRYEPFNEPIFGQGLRRL
jgi:hypothetical protein